MLIRITCIDPLQYTVTHLLILQKKKRVSKRTKLPPPPQQKQKNTNYDNRKNIYITKEVTATLIFCHHCLAERLWSLTNLKSQRGRRTEQKVSEPKKLSEMDILEI